MSFIKKNPQVFTLLGSALIAFILIVVAFSISPTQGTFITDVRADACGYYSATQVDMGWECSGGGSVVDEGITGATCYVCIGGGGDGGGGGGGGSCSPSCTDSGGNAITCGGPNTCYTGNCGSPCDAGCADASNPNICPQPPLVCSAGTHESGGVCVPDTCPASSPPSSQCPSGQTGSISYSQSAYPDCSWNIASNTCTTPVVTCSDGSPAPNNNANQCSCTQNGNCTCSDGSPAPGNNVNNCATTCEPTTSCVDQGATCGSIFDGCENISCGGSCTASLSITTNNSGSVWSVTPGGISGSGTTGAFTVYPGVSGTTYSLIRNAISGFTSLVSNTGGGASTTQITLTRGASGSFTITYTATNSGNSVISVSTNNSGASWTINPGNLTGTGTSGNYTVTPAQSGTTYTLTPGVLSGYNSAVTNLDGTGSSFSLLPNASKTFTITYTPTGSTSFDFSVSGTNPITVTKDGGNVPVPKTITLTSISGTARAVGLSIISSLPSGVSASISNNPCTPNPSCQQTITFVVSQNAAVVSSFPITIRATAN